MIRLIIIAIGLFILWVLFLSSFEKRRKIIIAIAAVVVLIAGLILDGWGEKPRSNIVNIDQIEVCGVTAKHSYRSSFDLDICLQNNANQGTVKRIALVVSAADCPANGLCTELQNVTRDFPIELDSGSKITVEQNLSFDQVKRDSQTVQWSVEPVSVKAVR